MRVRRKIVLHRNVRNQSSRNGARPRYIVIHTTESHNREGRSDLASIAAYFDNPSAQASSHVLTDADGHSARLVPDDAKAWTQMNYNAVCLSIEQIGFAATSRRSWLSRKNRRELRETARWIAYWSRHHNIPIRRKGAMRRGTGVVGHVDLGSQGGGHHDPGPNYPWRYVLAKARLYKIAQRKRFD